MHRKVQDLLNKLLHEAGSISDMEDLVNDGADIDAQDEQGRTLLHLAADHEDVDIVKFCLKNEAYQGTGGGWCSNAPLELATENGNKEIIKLLTEAS